MSWNIKTPGDYINGPLTVAGSAAITGDLTVDTSTLKVDSTNNRVGIGTVSPNNTLTVRGTQDAGIELNSADSNSSRLIFAYDPANTRWYINSTLSGIGTTLPLAFLIQNTEVARFNTTGNLAFATGKGIDFSAVTGGTGTATGNVLNDYEEGTFTATLTGGTTNPTVPVITTARYTKVGRFVTIQIEFINKDTTGASGTIGVSGLPFANGSVASSGIATLYSMATFTGSPFVFLDSSSSVLAFYGIVSSSNYSSVTHNAGSGRYSTIQVTYSV